MNTRLITILALAQLALVVFGYLFTMAAVKAGYPQLYGFEEAPWVLRMVRYYGLVLLAVPALWTAGAVYTASKKRKDLGGWFFAAGIGLIAVLALLLIYCVGTGLLGAWIWRHF